MQEHSAYERIVAKLSGVRETSSGAMALCPAHDDHNPSLSIKANASGVLLKCFAGCNTEEIVSELHLQLRDLYNEPLTTQPDQWLPHNLKWVEAYDYLSAEGRLVFQVIRALDANGEKTFIQRRPDSAKRSGWTWSVSSLPTAARAIPYALPEVLRAVEAGTPVWIAEGEKDVHALRRAGVTATCNAEGAGKWTSAHSEYLKGARVVIARDRDEAGAKHQRSVAQSLLTVAKEVRLVEPAEGNDAADHLEANRGLDEFVPVDMQATLDNADDWNDAVSCSPRAAPTGKAELFNDSPVAGPGATVRAANSEGDPYADSPISERVVADSLYRRWLWTPGLGWMTWTGCVWEARPEVAAAEVVRRWVDDEVARIALQGHPKETARAAAMQAENRISRILRLCRGQVLANAADFDQDPDILVCGNGVVDLRTGTLMKHDSERLVSHMTAVHYRPDAVHSDWTKALAAVPENVRVWLQLRLGQAATGHTPDDDRMLFFQGAGENGKTTLLAAAMSALGAYAGLVPDRLLLANADAHPTELMSLRGLRLAVIEETPEGRRLSVARLKKTVGTPWITARLVYKDSTTFKATHALLLSSNYRPVIEETDHGTWRRLGLITFPFRFMKSGAKLTAPTDRHGDPRLRNRLHQQTRQEAILSWLVHGAKAWYEAGEVMPPLPEPIERDTLSWRAESDSVLAYATERLEADPGSCVLSKDLLSDLNQWLAERGQQEWSERTLAARFGGHEWTTDRGVEKRKVRHHPGALSRSYFRCAPGPVTSSYQAWTGIRFRAPDDGGSAVPGVPDRSEHFSRQECEEVSNPLEQLEQSSEPLVELAR